MLDVIDERTGITSALPHLVTLSAAKVAGWLAGVLRQGVWRLRGLWLSGILDASLPLSMTVRQVLRECPA